MSDSRFEPPFAQNFGLMMTYKCQVACPHCIVQAGPHRTEEVAIEEACNWVDQIAAYRDGFIRMLALTGGEPFYNLASLRAIGGHAKACGLAVTAVTNGYWAQSLDEAVGVLAGVPFLDSLAISTDIYHQAAIPLAHVRHAVAACNAVGVPFAISVCTENLTDPDYLALLETLHEFCEPDRVVTAIVAPVGRATGKLDTGRYVMADELPTPACPSQHAPVIFPDGRVVACIGPVINIARPNPLVLGSLRAEPLAALLERAQTNPILHMVRALGPRKLAVRVREAGLGHELRQRYMQDIPCDLCYDLMSNPRIVAYLDELSRDDEFVRLSAYARYYYLHEPDMMEMLGLGGEES